MGSGARRYAALCNPCNLRTTMNVQMNKLGLLAILATLAILLPVQAIRRSDRKLLLHPDSPQMNQRAPDSCHVRLETTRGIIRLEMRRAWAPLGVDRFYNLVRHGYYDNTAVFRIRAGLWAQFGINGDPKIAQLWRTQTIPDDPRVESNVRGTMAF